MMISVTDGCVTQKGEVTLVDKIYVVVRGVFFKPYQVVSLSGELGELKGQVILAGEHGVIIACPKLDDREHVPFTGGNHESV